MKRTAILVFIYLMTLAFSCVGRAQQSGSAPTPAGSAVQSPTTGNAQATEGTTAGVAASSTDSYLIGPSDVVTVTVWKEPTLSGSLLVRPDGKISMSLLGDIQAAGLTPLKLADEIAAKLKKYYQDPNVSIVVDQIHSKVVYLLGEVTKTGPVELTPGMTLLKAISCSGGLTEFANKNKIYVLRDEDGKRQKIQVRYKEALKGDQTLDIVLKPGDTIVVP